MTEYIQRQMAGFLAVGTSTDPVTYPQTSRVWDMRDAYPASILKLEDGLKISFETQIAAAGSLVLPLPPEYSDVDRLFVCLRTNVLVKIVTVMPVAGTSSSLLRPGLSSDQNGVHSFVARTTSITVSNPSATTATIQYVAFKYPTDLSVSTNWRDGYQTTGVYST